MGQFYVQYEYWVAAFQLVFAMFGMGATLTLQDFKVVFKVPKAVLLGIAIQVLAVPLAAYLFINGFNLSGGVAIGVALICAVPGGTTSNIFTYFAKGNVPLSISITGLTTLACLATAPLILSLLITQYLPSEFVMPRQQIVFEIAITLLLPLVVGMWVLAKFATVAPLVSKWSIRLSLFGILMILVGSISAGRLDLDAFGSDNALLIVAFIVVLSLIGRFVPRLLGLGRAETTAIDMEVVVRNVNLGVLIKASMFPASAGANALADNVLFAILLYGGLQMLIAAVSIGQRRLFA